MQYMLMMNMPGGKSAAGSRDEAGRRFHAPEERRT